MPAITSVKSGTPEVLPPPENRPGVERIGEMYDAADRLLPTSCDPSARSTPRREKPIPFPVARIGAEEDDDYSRPAAERDRLTAAESTPRPAASAVRASSAAPIIPAASPSCVVRMRASGR